MSLMTFRIDVDALSTRGKGWAGIFVKGTRILRDRTARWESITWDRTRDEGHVLGTCMPCHCSATANSSMLLDDN